VLGKRIEEHPGFDPGGWIGQLPRMDAFGAPLFQGVGQQLSVSSTHAILGPVGAELATTGVTCGIAGRWS
jgi:DNA-3-methyladenine glycosylase II